MAVIEFVDRDVDAKGADDRARLKRPKPKKPDLRGQLSSERPPPGRPFLLPDAPRAAFRPSFRRNLFLICLSMRGGHAKD